MTAVTRAQSAKKAQNSLNRKHPCHDTPTKARFRARVKDLLKIPALSRMQQATRSVHQIGAEEGIAAGSQWRILHHASDRRATSNKMLSKRRGPKFLVTVDELHQAEQIIDSGTFDERAMTWDSLAYECGTAAKGSTLRTHMQQHGYRRCVACRKGWVSNGLRERRVKFAKLLLARFPHPEDWKRVRFSDEVHFSFGPQGRMYIIRKRGDRYCKDCIQDAQEPQSKDKDRVHCWAAIGYNFKSELHFYDIASNTNGKMTAQYYRDGILDGIVKPWIERGDNFILEEDRDGAHGLPQNKAGIVQQWKEQHGLQHYFNMSGSPDLSPIENAWQPLKQATKKTPHWTKLELESITAEAWYDGLDQATLNKWCLSMPQRLQEVIDSKGMMIGR